MTLIHRGFPKQPSAAFFLFLLPFLNFRSGISLLSSGLYYKNYDGVITTSYTSKETSINVRHRNLHSSVRRRNYAVVIFIIQATDDGHLAGEGKFGKREE